MFSPWSKERLRSAAVQELPLWGRMNHPQDLNVTARAVLPHCSSVSSALRFSLLWGQCVRATHVVWWRGMSMGEMYKHYLWVGRHFCQRYGCKNISLKVLWFNIVLIVISGGDKTVVLSTQGKLKFLQNYVKMCLNFINPEFFKKLLPDSYGMTLRFFLFPSFCVSRTLSLEKGIRAVGFSRGRAAPYPLLSHLVSIEM